MTPVMPCPISNFSLIPGTAFTIKNNYLRRCSLSKRSTKLTSSSLKFVLPLSTSVTFPPQYRRGCYLCNRSGTHISSATGADVAVGESDSPVANEDSSGDSEITSDAGEASEQSPLKSDAGRATARSGRPGPVKKSEMPPVKNEDLVPGATFTGKVKSIQPFGAFVDFGAFTDGLIHVSQLSDSYVKDVGKFVSVGQEVKVRLVEANTETGRISLTMRENDGIGNLQQQKYAAARTDKSSIAKKNISQPTLEDEEDEEEKELAEGEEDDEQEEEEEMGWDDDEEDWEEPRGRQRKMEVKSTKLVVGHELMGRVKNLARAGSYISLPEGQEGFLPLAEEDPFAKITGQSQLEVGQKVNVKVLRIIEGKATLTLKKDEAETDLEITVGADLTRTNAFVLAFRKNKDIASFLDEREKMTKIPVTSNFCEEKVGKVDESQQDVVSSSSQVVHGSVQTAETEAGQPEILVSEGTVSTVNQISVEASQTDRAGSDVKPDLSREISNQTLSLESKTAEVGEILAGEAIAEDKAQIRTPEAEKEIYFATPVKDEGAESNIDENGSITSSVVQEDIPSANEIIETEAEQPEILVSEGTVSTVNQISEEASPTDRDGSDGKSDLSGEISNQTLSLESETVELGEILAGEAIAEDKAQIQTREAEKEISFATPVIYEGAESNIDESGTTTSSVVQEDVPSANENIDKMESDANSGPSGDSTKSQILSSESQATEAMENQVDNAKNEVQLQTPPVESEMPSTSNVENVDVKPYPEKNFSITNSNGQSGSASSQESVTKAAISPALVKQLREETGAGMMDCKKALSETGGDISKAQEFLRKKGLASAEKKASRVTAEGRIGSYIHDSRIGVLVEVNCETDFVSRGDIFKELVDDLAMQVAACPQVKYLVTEDVPDEIVSKEKEIEMQKEDILSKPEQIRSKIVEGRIRKRLEELALLEQPYIKNDKLVVKDWVKQTIATIGENIRVRRFVRYNLGEGLQKKSQAFAAEVAAQTSAKPVASQGIEQPAAVEIQEIDTKPPVVTISAALVKQLRDETGGGMMDCKKALSETGGDLEKAQEYLRKKGLSTADKKSGRLAAEGRIGSYIHDSRIGVLLEVNCETDFVGRSEKFKELVDDLAMQVVAYPQVQYVSIEDIPESIVHKEKELEMQREDILSKPENIREKIVEGRVLKRLGELALLETPFIKDDSILVKDLVKQTIATLGENIKVRRFARFTLGETIEDTKTEIEA